MRIGRFALLSVVVLAALALLSACSDRDPGVAPSPTPPYRTKVELAPIDGLELIIRESFPPQYAIVITSGLPSGCHEFDRAVSEGWAGNTLTIRVTNVAPDDPAVACDALYRTVQTQFELGTAFIPRERYTIRVNDESLDFTAQ